MTDDDATIGVLTASLLEPGAEIEELGVPLDIAVVSSGTMDEVNASLLVLVGAVGDSVEKLTDPVSELPVDDMSADALDMLPLTLEVTNVWVVEPSSSLEEV